MDAFNDSGARMAELLGGIIDMVVGAVGYIANRGMAGRREYQISARIKPIWIRKRTYYVLHEVVRLRLSCGDW